MAFFINNTPGSFVVIRDPGGIPSTFSVDDMSPETTPCVVVTEISLRRGVNHQIRNTFSGVVHIHSFGERVGDMSISGLLLQKSCPNTPGVPVTSRESLGSNQVMTYFNNNSLLRRDRPITISMGVQASRGFLTDISVTEKGDVIPLGHFSLSLRLLPPTNNSRSGPGEAPRPT